MQQSKYAFFFNDENFEFVTLTYIKIIKEQILERKEELIKIYNI